MTRPDRKVLTNVDTAFEKSELSTRLVLWLAFAVLLLVVVGPLALTGIYRQAVGDVSRRLSMAPPGPQLQVSPADDLSRVLGAARQRLDSYGWVDRAHGIVHIPIARAMGEVAEHGIADFRRPAS